MVVFDKNPESDVVAGDFGQIGSLFEFMMLGVILGLLVSPRRRRVSDLWSSIIKKEGFIIRRNEVGQEPKLILRIENFYIYVNKPC